MSYTRLANALPEIMKLEDIHDFGPHIQEPDVIPVMEPYPDLTERERRLIIYYYTNFMAQFKTEKKLMLQLSRINAHLMQMVEEEQKR